MNIYIHIYIYIYMAGLTKIFSEVWCPTADSLKDNNRIKKCFPAILLPFQSSFSSLKE